MGLQQILLLLVACSAISCTRKNTQPELNVFRINLPREIHSIDPLLLRGTAKRYVLFNAHRGLYFYNSKNELQPHGAQSCTWSSEFHFDCKLSNLKWNDGSPILAKHYIYTFEQIIKLGDESLTDISDIKSMSVLSKSSLRFTFKSKVSGFKHRLASLVLTPRNENKLFETLEGQLFSGPYVVTEKSSKKIKMTSNTNFDSYSRPVVEGVFVDDPSAALNMFESGKLDFLRYLESSNISAYKDVLFAPFAKLDGLFLNQNELSLKNRKALIYALDFKSLKKLYSSPSTPGCLALPESFFSKSIECFEMNIKKAKELFSAGDLKTKPLKIYIPSADADEHKKLALWAREQWQKNLGISVEIKLVEQKIFYSKMKEMKYSIYRKAHSLDNLSCDDAVRSLQREAEFKSLESNKTDCRKFFIAALNSYSWIPLGLPYYAHLPSKNFSGYYINLLGQFGLDKLEKN